MRAVRDFVFIVCAVISTACLVYVVYNIEMVRRRLSDTSAALDTLLKRSGNDPENDVFKHLKKPGDVGDPGYSKVARDELKKLIAKPTAK